MNLFFDFSILTFDFLLLVTFPNPDKVGRQSNPEARLGSWELKKQSCK